MTDLCNGWSGTLIFFAETWFTWAHASSSAALLWASASISSSGGLCCNLPIAAASSQHRRLSLVAAVSPRIRCRTPFLRRSSSRSSLPRRSRSRRFLARSRSLAVLAPRLQLSKLIYNALTQEVNNYICSVSWRRLFLYPGNAFPFSLTSVNLIIPIYTHKLYLQ